jgi:hypothetical protein
MRKLSLLVALLCASPAWGAIAFVGASSTCGTASSGTSVVTTYTSAGGHQIAIAVGVKPTSIAVSSVTDSGGSSYPAKLVGANNGSSYRSELWGTTSSVASTSFTVNFSGTITQAVVCVSEYSGGGSFGATASGAGSAGTSWSQAVTTTVSNSWVITSIVINAAEASFTGSGSTVVRANNTTTFVTAVADVPCGAAGSCTNSGTYASSHTNEVTAVELKPAGAVLTNKPPVVL